MSYYVAIDIGGTFIKYGLISEKESFINQGKMPTEAEKGGVGIANKVIEIVTNYQRDYSLSGVCISTAGMVNTQTGEIFYSAPLIPNYIGTNFKELIYKKFALPCTVENDVNCAGLAEAVSGNGQGKHSTLCLTVGTGIGGCFISEGKVFHGYHYSACEVGYMKQGESDFQTKGATRILVEQVAQKKGQAIELWSGEKIFDLAKQGDSDCQEAIEQFASELAIGISNICYVLNPQQVLLGGGVMAQKAYLEPLIKKHLRKNLVPALAENLELAFAKYENQAGMLGAYYYFLQNK